jgi:CheY-like chemotaxis protein
MGYANTIIALTANALIGRAEMFLKNGFDGFISKPIDSRELNSVLNDFIRNSKPPEVIEAARREQLEKELKKSRTMLNNNSNMSHSDKEIFFRKDAENAINVLGDLYSKFNSLDDEEIQFFITTVHGMKSALSNVDENELSAAASRLEQAGETRNFAVLSDETPVFINALQSLIMKLEPAEDVTVSPEDQTYLLGKLRDIKTACAGYDSKAIKTTLKELRQNTWPKEINTVLEEITMHVLHSKFDKAAYAVERVLDGN